MKCFLIVFAVVMLTFVDGSPAKGSTKPEMKTKPCLTKCSDDYTPVCGGDEVGKPISFGNECVLNNYNCEQEKHFKILSKGECPGGGSVRLA